jgi:hypothetical protein
VNGQLHPELRNPGSKPQKLTANQSEYKAAWLGTANQYTEAYQPLKDLCAKAEELDYKWRTQVATTDLPESWVSSVLRAVCTTQLQALHLRVLPRT